MPFLCKGICHLHPNYQEKNSSLIIGKDVYFCRVCDLAIKIKNNIRCICCNALLSIKSRLKNLNRRKRCQCGCGEWINSKDKGGRKRNYKNNHDKKIKDAERKCIKCNTQNTQHNKYRNNVYPLWHKFGLGGVLCHNCYNKKLHYIKKLKKMLSELHYSAVMKTI